MEKSEWIIKVTYNTDNWKKYCELTYPFKGTQKTLEKRKVNVFIADRMNLTFHFISYYVPKAS